MSDLSLTPLLEKIMERTDSIVAIGYPKLHFCGATVTWAKTRAGKNILMDFHATPNGTFYVIGHSGKDAVVGTLTDPPEGAKAYTCHFKTCVRRRG